MRVTVLERKDHRRRMAEIFYASVPQGALCDGRPEFMSRPGAECPVPITADYTRRHPEEFKTQLALCHRCQIQDECLDIALRFGEEFGIYGGLLPHERLDMEER